MDPILSDFSIGKCVGEKQNKISRTRVSPAVGIIIRRYGLIILSERYLKFFQDEAMDRSSYSKTRRSKERRTASINAGTDIETNFSS